MVKNIFPEMFNFIEKSEKESLLKQKSLVIWFTGLSGAGKSTLAQGLETLLFFDGILTQVLDGDKIRNGLNKNLGFSEDDRVENIRRIAEVSKLFCECGIITISAFISPTHYIRKMAENIIGKDNFFEIYVSTPITTCEIRDKKGLYIKARTGIIPNFTGISAPYEPPINPKISIDTTNLSIDESVKIIYNKIISLIKL
jgi:adenylylsulfate kinase